METRESLIQKYEAVAEKYKRTETPLGDFLFDTFDWLVFSFQEEGVAQMIAAQVRGNLWLPLVTIVAPTDRECYKEPIADIRNLILLLEDVDIPEADDVTDILRVAENMLQFRKEEHFSLFTETLRMNPTVAKLYCISH